MTGTEGGSDGYNMHSLLRVDPAAATVYHAVQAPMLSQNGVPSRKCDGKTDLLLDVLARKHHANGGRKREHVVRLRLCLHPDNDREDRRVLAAW